MEAVLSYIFPLFTLPFEARLFNTMLEEKRERIKPAVRLLIWLLYAANDVFVSKYLGSTTIAIEQYIFMFIIMTILYKRNSGQKIYAISVLMTMTFFVEVLLGSIMSLFDEVNMFIFIIIAKLLMIVLILCFMKLYKRIKMIETPALYQNAVSVSFTIATFIYYAAFNVLKTPLSMIIGCITAVSLNILSYASFCWIIIKDDRERKEKEQLKKIVFEKDEIIHSLESKQLKKKLFVYGTAANGGVVDADDIESVSIFKKVVTLNLKGDGKITYRGQTLEFILKEINNKGLRFIQKSRSELLNLNYINRATKDEFYIGDQAYEITDGYKKAVEEFQKWRNM